VKKKETCIFTVCDVLQKWSIRYADSSCRGFYCGFEIMDQLYVTTNEFCNICKHFMHAFIIYLIKRLYFYIRCIDVLNSLKMIKIDRNI